MWRLPWLPTLLLASAVLGMACSGGSEEVTLGAYLQRVDAIFAETDERFVALGDRCSERTDSEGARVRVALCFFDASVAIWPDFTNALENIDPPDEAAAAHDELLAAGGELSSLIEDYSTRLADVQSTAELEEVLSAHDLLAAGDRFDQACLSLQDLATETGIELDLACTDEAGG